MAGSVNKVILIGNLGADPEIRRTQDGRPIANLRVATSESWKDERSGERRERTEWHRVVIFNEGLGKTAERYLEKGAKVFLEGKLTTRKWHRQGRSRALLDRSGAAGLQLGSSPCSIRAAAAAARNSSDDFGSSRAERGRASASRRWPAPASPADMDDEIPF